MESRCDTPAPELCVIEGRGDAVRKVNPANGQAGLAERRASRRQIPDSRRLTPVTRVRTGPGSHRRLCRPEKPLPSTALPVPHTDTGRQGEISPGERATLC